MNDINLSLENYLTQTNSEISISLFIISLILSGLAAYALKKVYIRYGMTLSNRERLGNIFIPVAMTTALIITIVKSSLALSLGLVGALSIVRFRSAIKEPEELAYLFICIAIGLGFGANQHAITIFGVVLVTFAIMMMRKDVVKDSTSNSLLLTISNSAKNRLNIESIITLISRYVDQANLKRIDDGEIINEVSFVVRIKNHNDLLEMRKELLKIDENLNLTFLDSSKII